MNDNEINTYLWNFDFSNSSVYSMGVEVIIPKNTVIYKADTIPEYAYYILSGKIISYEYTVTGNERIYAISTRGSLVLDDSLVTRKPIPVSFRTTQETHAIRIDHEAMIRAISSNPDFAMAVIHSTADKLLSAMEIIRQSSSTSAAWKVCNLLLTYAKQYGTPYDNKILISEKISQQNIANLLGINRITTLRVMKDLKDMGLIEQINGFYCIRDEENLIRHMDFLEMEQ